MLPPDALIPPPVLRPLGDTALSVTFGTRIDPVLIAQVHAFDAALNALALPGLVETVPTYCAITLHIDPLTADPAAIEAAIRGLAVDPPRGAEAGTCWEVPVTYGAEAGRDLADVAAHAGLTPSDVVDAHCAAAYTVAMVGFMPGFAYLSGLDARLAMPRRADPRPRIPASSIAIGGAQTAISSLEGPSGWHLIGRTPVRPYQSGRTPEFLFAPGDRILFRPISPAEWDQMDAAASAGDPVATRRSG